MAPTTPLRRALWLAILAGLGLVAALFAACGTVVTPAVTPTATRTPRPPTATPTLTPTPTPTATPTPAWPVSVSCEPGVPGEVCQSLREVVEGDAGHLAWVEDATRADISLRNAEASDGEPFATWIYALVGPFFTLQDGASLTDLEASWTGGAVGPFAAHSLLVVPDTQAAMRLGIPSDSIGLVEPSQLLTEAIRLDGWAVVPFGELEPRWKVLKVDGVSPLDRGLEPGSYPLALSFAIDAKERPDALTLLPSGLTNRDDEKMTTLMMTGVTALTRGTARTMEREGVSYPAGDIREWLVEPDITHTSNEVSFAESCPTPTGESTMVFCSDPRHFELLEYVDIDVLELTGNHLLDWGVSAMESSLRLYEERGLPYFGGGWTLEEARRPLTISHGVHTFGFLGCNPVGPAYAWATAEGPGAASCDYDALVAQVRQLRDRGVIPIVTFQYWEFDQYAPTSSQQADFRTIAEAGAVIVSGSQAHWPQGFDFQAGAFIHYGLGNLFFDQMQQLEYRQEFLDRHVFYDGRHVSTELLTAMLEDYARPRPMTSEERRALLASVFAVSGW